MNAIFRKFEVIGKTKDAAKEEVKDFTLMVDASSAYNKWAKDNATNEDNVKDWMKDYLRKKKFDKAGLGAYIVLQSAVVDSRERPYKVNKPKYDVRTHTPEKFYVLRDRATGTEVAFEKTSKAAEQSAKEFVTENQETVDIFTEWKVKEGNALYATVEYTPSKGTQSCKLLAFGYANAD